MTNHCSLKVGAAKQARYGIGVFFKDSLLHEGARVKPICPNFPAPLPASLDVCDQRDYPNILINSIPLSHNLLNKSRQAEIIKLPKPVIQVEKARIEMKYFIIQFP